MLDAILDAWKTAEFDFRPHAYDGDPLKYLFPEWVPMYRLKWAVARILKPATILEIGVRFGYSALALLHGHPGARYLGLDLDVAHSGGVPGASAWARRILAPFDAEVRIADTQAMTHLPGGDYDLVHVDGRQDGDSTVHDLALATAQGRHVLVDGYFRTRLNFQAVNAFIYGFRHRIETFCLLPGAPGDLLIRVAPRDPSGGDPAGHQRHDSSLEIRSAYTRNYFLGDCGGFDAFKRSQGRRIEDPRLLAVSQIAEAVGPGRALDLGCGRGELALHLARRGFEVTAVDYSPEAVEIARTAAQEEPQHARLISFHCADVSSAPWTGRFDLALASDLVEHLSPQEIQNLLQRVAGDLAPDGLLVIHTNPNRWVLDIDHPRRRETASAVGAYLLPDPRTAFEKLMHVNEQTPDSLRDVLRMHLPHVRVWCAHEGDPGGSLVRPFSREECERAPDIFAVASHQPLPLERLRELLHMPAVSDLAASCIHISLPTPPRAVRACSEFLVSADVSCAGSRLLRSMPPHPVHLSYHWIGEDGRVEILDGLRTPLVPPLRGNQVQRYDLRVLAPPSAGSWTLRICLVQELVKWFDDPGGGATADVSMRVQPVVPGNV